MASVHHEGGAPMVTTICPTFLLVRHLTRSPNSSDDVVYRWRHYLKKLYVGARLVSCFIFRVNSIHNGTISWKSE